MASLSSLNPLQGNCPTPFLQETKFPSTGGLVTGRLCIPIEILNATCCIPCPITDWTYSDGFEERADIANWVNVASAFATVFILLSFAFLAVKWTHRHYLSICLAIGVLFMELAFIIPLGSKPDQCFNEITPNDMHSDLSCGFSGAFLLFGGWAIIVWVFWRALLLHLQICWEVVPGPKFFYVALTLGWGIPGAGLALVLTLTGVSYRFGSVCHIDHQSSLAVFWGPLLAFAAVALVLQFITMGYCIQVYVRSLIREDTGSSFSSQLPSTRASSVSTTRQTYRRVKKVVQTQWRGAMIVLVIIFEVVFFSVVFVSLDNSTRVTESLIEKASPWIQCLVLTQGDKQRCLPQAAAFVPSEGIVLTVLIFLGMSGFWCLLFLGRWSMVLGWRDLVLRKLLAVRGEFISADVQRKHGDPRTYEMLDSTRSNPGLNFAAPDQAVLHPQRHSAQSQVSTRVSSNNEYFGKITVQHNFAGPIPHSPNRSPDPEYRHSQWYSRAHEEHVYAKDYA